MKKSVRSHKKITEKYIFSILVLIFIFVILFCYFNKNKFIPIYKIKDRTKEVEKVKKKYTDEEVIGWIKVQGTNIDYPIIKYRNGMLDGENIDYAWTNVKVDKLSNFLTISSHNLRNVSSKPIIGDDTMNQFEQLMSFIYYDFNKDNKYIQYTINGKNYLYQIFSVALVNNSEVDYYESSYKKKDLKEYLNYSLEDSFFKYDVDVNSNDKIISLVTCTRFNGYISNVIKVDAKLIKKNKGYNYNVSEKSNYTEIKKVLEGVDDSYA